MKRLLFLATGAILILVWINANPPVQNRKKALGNVQIKTISRSGLVSMTKIGKPVDKGPESGKNRKKPTRYVSHKN